MSIDAKDKWTKYYRVAYLLTVMFATLCDKLKREFDAPKDFNLQIDSAKIIDYSKAKATKAIVLIFNFNSKVTEKLQLRAMCEMAFPDTVKDTDEESIINYLLQHHCALAILYEHDKSMCTNNLKDLHYELCTHTLWKYYK